MHVRRRVSGRTGTGRLDGRNRNGRNGHLAKATTATSGVAPDARSAARCARSGAASPRVRVGGIGGGGRLGGGLPVRFRGLPVFQIALFLGLYFELCNGNYDLGPDTRPAAPSACVGKALPWGEGS